MQLLLQPQTANTGLAILMAVAKEHVSVTSSPEAPAFALRPGLSRLSLKTRPKSPYGLRLGQT